MSNQWQARRGTTAQNDAFTGASGEITYDTDSQGLRVHDGTKQGGYLIDTVVDFQKPTAENNYTWYRLYASGFVEQGGTVPAISGTKTVVFPVPMLDTNYTILKTMETNSSSQPSSYNQFSFYNKTTADATTSTAGVGFSWQVSGMAA